LGGLLGKGISYAGKGLKYGWKGLRYGGRKLGQGLGVLHRKAGTFYKNAKGVAAKGVEKLKNFGRKAWIPPKGWQGPSSKAGKWLGRKGDSIFVLSDDVAKKAGVASGTRIRFVKGKPDFAPFVKNTPAGTSGVFEVPGLVFEHTKDADIIRKYLAQEAGMTPNAVRKWLRQNKLSMHHFRGRIIQLVPERLHSALHHTGPVGGL